MKKIVFIVSLFIQITSFAQLVGNERNGFISSSSNACYRTQRQGSPNVNISDNTLHQYCNCAANYVADILNHQLAIDIENGVQKMNPLWGQMAQKYCQINYSKY